jgi:hypothetical protein
MLVAFLTTLLLFGQQKEIAHFGECQVMVRPDSATESATVSVVRSGKLIWSARCDSDQLVAREDPGIQRFYILAPPVTFAAFRMDGSLEKQVPFEAARDPYPFFYSSPYAVWGADIFNWIKYKAADLRWQNETRDFYAMDLRSGRVKKLRDFITTGLPLVTVHDELISVAPIHWVSALPKFRTRQFWLRRFDLASGSSSKHSVTLSLAEGNLLFCAIVGFEDWEAFKIKLDSPSGRLTMSCSDWPKGAIVTLAVPKPWLK